MTALVLLDHDSHGVKQPSRSAIAAAQKLGEVHVLVAGSGVQDAAQAAAKLPGVAKVIVADAPAFEHPLAEPLAALLVSLAPAYAHILAAATANGKNVMPRVAAQLDVQPISDITAVEDADTFVRPIYAGNAIATVQVVRHDQGDHRARGEFRSGSSGGRQRVDREERRRSKRQASPSSSRPS